MSSDSESISSFDLLTWFETNQKKIYTGGATVLVLALGVYLINHFTLQGELSASNALFEARFQPASQTSAGEAPPQDPAALLAVASAHSGKAASGRATLFAAQAYFDQGDYEQALAQFQSFLAQFGNSSLSGSARFGMAACKEALNQSQEAIQGYQQVATAYPNSFLAYQSNLAEAGLHEDAGDAAKALALYDRVLLPTVSTSFSTEAGTRREALLKKHPELAPVESEATVETVPEDAAP